VDCWHHLVRRIVDTATRHVASCRVDCSFSTSFWVATAGKGPCIHPFGRCSPSDGTHQSRQDGVCLRPTSFRVKGELPVDLSGSTLALGDISVGGASCGWGVSTEA